MENHPSLLNPADRLKRGVLWLALIGAVLIWSASLGWSQESPACTDCHDVGEAFQDSVHGEAGLTCDMCHGELEGLDDPPHEAPEPVDCSGCHDTKVSEGHPPLCYQCHGGHDVTPASSAEPSSRAALLRQMCSNCHEEIVGEYFDGVHGSNLLRNNPDVPDCMTCHGGHQIKHASDPRSLVNHSALARTCAGCHDDQEIADKYGLPPSRLETFVGSYHGLASEFGDGSVARCDSCHGTHKILPSDDPGSSIHPSNMPSTCGACHLQAGEHFAEGKVHVRDRYEDNPFSYTIKRAYQILITGLMTVFAAFIAVDFNYRLRKARRAKQ